MHMSSPYLSQVCTRWRCAQTVLLISLVDNVLAPRHVTLQSTASPRGGLRSTGRECQYHSAPAVSHCHINPFEILVKGKPVLDEYLTPTFVRAMGLQCSELANLDLVPLAKLTIVALSGMISGIKVQCPRALS